MLDYNGRRFNFRDDQYNVMYRDATKAEFGSLDVKVHSGTGLDPNWSIVRQNIAQRLTQFRGVADFGLTPESTKDIAVGTVETLERQGNVPIADLMLAQKGLIETDEPEFLRIAIQS